MSSSASSVTSALLAPPKGRIAKKWSMFVLLGMPGYPQVASEALMAGAIGTAKTAALVTWLVVMALAFPGARLALVRDTLENLKRSALKTLFERAGFLISQDHKKGKGQIARFIKRENRIEFDNGSEIYLFGLNDVQARERALGSEWAGIAVDQLESVKKTHYLELIPRLRQMVYHEETGELVHPMIKSTANINLSGSSWIRRHFLGGDEPFGAGDLADDVRIKWVITNVAGQRAMTARVYIAAHFGENESAHPRYLQTLAAAGELAQLYTSSEWEPDQGEVFAGDFDPKRNVYSDDPEDYTRFDLYVGLDFGIDSPTVALFGLWDRDRRLLYVDQEFMDRNRDAGDYAEGIASIISTYVRLGVRQVHVYADPQLWNRTGVGARLVDAFEPVFRSAVPDSVPLVIARAYRKGAARIHDPASVSHLKRLIRDGIVRFHRFRARRAIEVVDTVTWKDVDNRRHEGGLVDFFDALRYLLLNLPDREVASVHREEDRSDVPSEFRRLMEKMPREEGDLTWDW